MHGAPLRLRCEHLENPLGIDIRRPRLSWWSGDTRPAEIQTSYQLIVASTPQRLAADEGDCWDSGRVDSQQCFGVVYRGRPLQSGQRVWWKIRSYDSDGLPSPWSEPGWFEAGLLDPEDWQASWIAASLTGSRATAAPVPLLARKFELPAAPVSARLYLTARGLYRAEINGLRVGTEELTPGWSNFADRLTYQAYDVTSALRAGSNAIGVVLADGWFAGCPGLGERQHYGRRPELLAQLRLQLADGATMDIVSDHRWHWRPSGILLADPVAGESVDGAQRAADWSDPKTARDWFPVVLCQHDLVPKGSRQPPVRVCETLHPELIASAEARLLYRLPSTVVGRVRLQLRLPEGALVRVRYGLEPDETGVPDWQRGADVYVCGGAVEGEHHEFAPFFSVHGFRYLEVTGDVFRRESIDVEVDVLAQATSRNATFASDQALLNRLFDEIAGHLRATLQWLPLAGVSDNQRVAEVAAAATSQKSAMLLYDTAAFYAGWLNHLQGDQLPDGGFPAIVPVLPDLDDCSIDAGPGASDSFVRCAWQLFRLYGDRRVLEQRYPAVCLYVEGLQAQWPDCIRGEGSGDAVATVWFYRTARTAARIAGLLGHLTDHESFDRLAGQIRTAFRQRFLSRDGRLVGDSLEARVAALAHGLLAPKERGAALEEILRCTLRRGEPPLATPSGSMVLVPDLLRTLTMVGRADLACHLLIEHCRGKTAPGALLRAGAMDWLLESLAGLSLDGDYADSHNAFRSVRIQPRPPLRALRQDTLPDLPIRAVEVALDTISGRYTSSWQITEHAFELEVLVPGNCAASVVMPDGCVHQVGAGRFCFAMPLQESGDGIPVLQEVSASR